MIVEKKITELQIGHYVVDIVEQKGSYVLTGAGNIKTQQVIDALKGKGVASLLVDTSKSLVVAKKHDDGSIEFSSDTTEASSEKDNSPSTLIPEITKAKEIFKESKNIQRQVFSDALNGREIDLAPVKQVTNKAIKAIFKNPDALACVLNIRIKDEYLLEHSVSVSVLITIFARHLKIDPQIIQQLTIGAFLHDVGKIKIPDKVLNKPGKLTDVEFTVMKSHVNHSINIIENTTGISELSLEVAALHHEKLDGSGYPYKIKANDISLYGRMITICDIFDALTADRVYKKGYSHIKAFNILRHLATQGTLDLALVDKFIQCIGVYPVGSLVELNSNRLAIVEGRNSDDPIRPKVRSFYDVNYEHYTMAEDIDLSKDDDFIIKGVRANEFNLDMNKIVEFLMMQG